MQQTDKRTYNIFFIAFIVLNVLATYFVTTEFFNRYIINFDYTFKGVINSIIGNVAFLLFVILLVNLSTKKLHKRMFALVIVTVFLNSALFGINVYNRFYGTSFTFKAMTIFKNPAGSFGLTLVYEALREIITYYRIILFIPLIVLAIFYGVYAKKKIKDVLAVKFCIKKAVTNFLLVILLFMTNIVIFSKTVGDQEIINSAKSTYATQNIGLYNYLVLDLMGFEYENIEVNETKIKETLDEYNKNKNSYVNLINGQTYNKSVQVKNAGNINGKLIDDLNSDDTLTGILEDYNLVLVHLESFNYFLLENPMISKYYYNLQALLEESYVFNNFYTNVGLGNSFDAELAVLTGLMPNGTSTISWEYSLENEEQAFDFQSLPKLFKQKGYIANSFHGNDENFYNRKIVHPNMFGFDDYYGKMSIIEDLGYESYEKGLNALQELYEHQSGSWISDRGVFDFMNSKIDNFYSDEQKFLAYALTILPHTPFYYDPYNLEPLETTMYEQELIETVDIVTLKYLNYAKYYNEQFRIIMEDVNGYGDDYNYDEENIYQHKKIAYVFYGDHGSGLKHDDINYLYDNELDVLEIKQKLFQTLAFIYVPGDEVVTKEIEGQTIHFREGLLKGEQSLVRSQIDLHRTLVDLFNLPITSKDYLFGVHGMSDEPTYSLDNKSLYMVTDKFFTTLRNNTSYNNFGNASEEEMERLKAMVTKLKRASDTAMNKNLYKKIKQ